MDQLSDNGIDVGHRQHVGHRQRGHRACILASAHASMLHRVVWGYLKSTAHMMGIANEAS